MNNKVEKIIHGHQVAARPVFKGAATPAYWLGAIDEYTLFKRFPSAPAVFRFVHRFALRG